MDENRNSANFPETDVEQAEAAVAWQAERFLQTGLSLAPGGANFLPVTRTWHRDGDMVEHLLDYQDRFAAGMDDRVRGAHLMSFYSHHLSIVTAAVYLRTGLVPDLHPDRLMFRFEPIVQQGSGAPAGAYPSDIHRFHFCFQSLARSDNGVPALHDGFVESVLPVIGLLQDRTGLSPVAQWRLVADGIAGAFLEVGAALGEEDRAMAAANAILSRVGSPLCSEAAHYTRIGTVCDGIPVERVFRLRSGCCLYYRTKGGDFCDVCVLLDDETKKDRLRAHVERSGGL